MQLFVYRSLEEISTEIYYTITLRYATGSELRKTLKHLHRHLRIAYPIVKILSSHFVSGFTEHAVNFCNKNRSFGNGSSSISIEFISEHLYSLNCYISDDVNEPISTQYQNKLFVNSNVDKEITFIRLVKTVCFSFL